MVVKSPSMIKMEICLLSDEELWFPHPSNAADDGLLAVGGDLSVERLLLAYSYGIFPWYAFRWRSMPHWYCPQERFVIFPKEIHVSHSMKQMLRQERYRVTFNQDFEGVIQGCSKVDERCAEYGAWLGHDMIAAYTKLHHLGYAASVEVWEVVSDSEGNKQQRLVGGLYGVTLRNAFFGESMFSLVPNASKLALIHWARFLESQGAHFIDCQFETPHLRSMGGRSISYEEYMGMLEKEKLPFSD